MARRCIRRGRGKGGRTVCRQYAGKSTRRRGRGYGLLPRHSVAGTKCVRFKKYKGVKRCASYKFKKKGQRGIWRGIYDKAGWDLGPMPTQGKSCKGYVASGRACKVRCAGFNQKAGAKTAAGAKAACKRRKGGKKRKRR